MNKVNLFIKTTSKLCAVLALSLSAQVYAQQAQFVWSEDGANGSRLLISEYNNGNWKPGEVIVEDSHWNLLPALGADSKNDKMVVYSTIESNGSVLKYAMKRGQNWESPQVLSNTMKTNLAPVVVFDDSDVSWVFWAANNGDDDDIYVSRFINGAWSEPQMVNEDNNVPDILPEAGQDEAGNIWVSWQSLTDNGYETRTKSFAKRSSLKMSAAQGMSLQQIQQSKSRSDLTHQMAPPKEFKSRGRASFYFPDDKQRPSKAVKGNLIQ